MKTFLRLLRFSKPYHHYVPEYIVYILLYTIFSLLNFTLLIPLLQVLFKTDEMPNVPQMPHFSFSVDYFKNSFYYWANHYVTDDTKFSVLIYVCIALIICVVLKNLFGFLAQKVLTRMRVNLVRKMREELFHSYSTQSLQFYHNEKKGDLLSTISSDVVEIENSVVSGIQTIFREPLNIISIFCMLFYYSTRLTLFTLVFFPVSGALISIISRRLKKKSQQSQKAIGVLLNQSEEAVSGIRIIKSFNAEKFVQRKFSVENNRFSRITKAILNQRELASPLSEVLGVLVIVVVILYGSYLIFNHQSELSASVFIVYIVFYTQIITPAKNIASAFTYLQRGLAAGERVIRVLDTKQTITETQHPVPFDTFENEIEFRNVSFRYDVQNVLNNINLIVPKGKLIALVGNSGGGKSTLTDLLPRFYDVTEGAICIDGKDIRQFSLKDLRDHIGIVSQEAILFNDTIYNNITFGSENATPEAVYQAARIANAYNFISEMEQGFETTIGDRGMKLSGGQRQRLTIARAVLKNAPILILDEATSALDSESEKLVQTALESLMENRTSIVIAHRLSTIRHADEIIVLQKGEIVERGTHDELLCKTGVYKRLVDMQEVR